MWILASICLCFHVSLFGRLSRRSFTSGFGLCFGIGEIRTRGKCHVWGVLEQQDWFLAEERVLASLYLPADPRGSQCRSPTPPSPFHPDVLWQFSSSVYPVTVRARSSTCRVGLRSCVGGIRDWFLELNRT